VVGILVSTVFKGVAAVTYALLLPVELKSLLHSVDIMAAASNAPVYNDDYFDQSDDFNGDFFTLGAEGERYVKNDGYVYVFPGKVGDKIPDGLYKRGDAAANRLAGEWRMRFIKANVDRLEANEVKGTDALRVAYLRLAVVQMGYVKPDDDPKAFFCEYPEREWMSEDDCDALPDKILDEFVADSKWRQTRKEQILDMICLVAYIFRARGHHYTKELAVRYEQVWEKTQHEKMDLAWKYIATNAFHALYPKQLDDVWMNAALTNHCNGALKKRFNTAAAGVAIWRLMQNAVDDVLTVVPGLADTHATALNELLQVNERLDVNRWLGSVNAHLYGSTIITNNEARIGALAATVEAMLKAFNAQHPLAASPALKRVAANSPITGYVLAIAANAAVKNDKFASKLLTRGD